MNKTTLLLAMFSACLGTTAQLECSFYHINVAFPETYTEETYGGAMASYGCEPIDPNYWMSDLGNYVTINFIELQNFPGIRVWGMNDDDVASVAVNGVAYSLDETTAWYLDKVVCGLSPGPDGILFNLDGNIAGANDNVEGNYSYQDIFLNMEGVSTITVTGLSGAGWGFAGVLLDCYSGIDEDAPSTLSQHMNIQPNPFSISTTIQFSTPVHNAELNLFDVCGKKVKEVKNVSGERIELQSGDLPCGIYFIRLLQDGKIIATEKVVIED